MTQNRSYRDFRIDLGIRAEFYDRLMNVPDRLTATWPVVIQLSVGNPRLIVECLMKMFDV